MQFLRTATADEMIDRYFARSVEQKENCGKEHNQCFERLLKRGAYVNDYKRNKKVDNHNKGSWPCK